MGDTKFKTAKEIVDFICTTKVTKETLKRAIDKHGLKHFYYNEGPYEVNGYPELTGYLFEDSGSRNDIIEEDLNSHSPEDSVVFPIADALTCFYDPEAFIDFGSELVAREDWR